MERRAKVALIASFIGLILMSTSTSFVQNQGYEISIYRSTPLLFWVGLGISVLTGVVMTITARKPRLKLLSVGSTTVAILLLVSLPYLRGFHFYGQEDALQHLGFARQIMDSGTLGENPYPGLHILSAFISMVIGRDVNSGMLLVPAASLFVFICSTLLLAQYLSDSQSGDQPFISVLLACSIPTITAVVIPRIQPIATISAMHITPFLIWITLSLTNCDYIKRQRLYFCLLIFQLSLLVFHPQFLLVYLAFIATYAILETFVSPLSRSQLSIPQHRLMIPALLIPGVAELYRLLQGNLFSGAFSALIGLLISRSGVSAASPSGTGLSKIGGSSVVLFTRALSVQVIIGLLAVVAGILAFYRLSQKRQSELSPSRVSSKRQLLFLVACVPVAGLGLIYLIGGGLSQSVRYFAFIVGLCVPLAAISISSFQTAFDRRFSVPVTTAILIVCIVISVPATFMSPYLYTPSQQVTETQMEGYDWALSANDPILAVDTDVGRHVRSLRGYQSYLRWIGSDMDPGRSVRGHGLVPPHFNNHQLSQWRSGVNTSWYLITTEYSRKQQLSLYKGYQFNHSDFAYLDQSKTISVIYDNGGARVHRVSLNEARESERWS